MQRNVKRMIALQKKRHMFNRFRIHARFVGVPYWLSFSLTDFLLSPEHARLWVALRLAAGAYVWGIFAFLATHKWARDRIAYFAMSVVVIPAMLINLQIYQTKGEEPLHFFGLILYTIATIQLFRLNRLQSAIAQVLVYLPTAVILPLTSEAQSPTRALLQASFFLGLVGATLIGGTSEDTALRMWARSSAETKDSLARLQRTEFLLNHFPRHLRKEIESGELKIGKQVMMPGAVVGFADITASTRIANSVDLFTDWQLKERFLEAATKRATESGMVVLTHLGDGFLFLANYRNSPDWHYNILTFFENLVLDYELVTDSLREKLGDIPSGVKFGIATGPALVGLLGETQSYFTAIGPDVNLAARLCASAASNEIVISSRVWDTLKSIVHGWEAMPRLHGELKGFSQEIPAFHVAARLPSLKGRCCESCGTGFQVRQTPEGRVGIYCEQWHPAPTASIPNLRTRSAA